MWWYVGPSRAVSTSAAGSLPPLAFAAPNGDIYPGMATTIVSRNRASAGPWVAYAAAVWALTFSALHVVWAAGWYVGLDQESARRAFQQPWFLTYDLVVAAVCLVGAAVALALVQPWGRLAPRRLIGVLAWGWHRTPGAPRWSRPGPGRVLRRYRRTLVVALDLLGGLVRCGRGLVRMEHMALRRGPSVRCSTMTLIRFVAPPFFLRK